MLLKSVQKFVFLVILVSSGSVYAEAENSALNLTENESGWLHAHPSVKFTGDPNWLPYETFDEKGNYKGIVSEHLALIAETTGLAFEMSPSKTWTESTEKAKQGKVDILSETDDSDLKSHLNFTIPYISNPIVIAMLSRENYVESINNISDRKIALIKDYGYAAKIRRKYKKINFITVDDIQDGLVSVSTGKVDALLCTLALCSYTIAELGLNNVKITGKTEFDTKLALGVQKNLPELLSILNKAIKKITPKQQQLILDRWIKDKFVERTDYTLAYQILGIAIILLSITIFWNRRLSKEINLRIATEEDLKSAEEVLRLSHQRLSSHREHTPLAVIEWNTDYEVVDWNHAAENMFGYKKREVLHRKLLSDIFSLSDKEIASGKFEAILATKTGVRNYCENIRKDGQEILCEWYNTPLVDDYNNVIGFASLVDDVTERKRSENVIWKQANFDSVTNLPNRNMFQSQLAQGMTRADRDAHPLALFLIDLDQFKEVNDTLGHDTGDLLLRAVGHRISQSIRHVDTLARLGGDEFTIILTDLHDKHHVEDIAQKIIDSLEQAFHIGEETIHISGSIGITLYPSDATDVDSLMKNADQAMYTAKKQGRSCYSFFTQSLQDAAQIRRGLMNDLRMAQKSDQFDVYFQPVIDLNTNQISKSEALIRWKHPNRGLVNPLDFIPLAEEIGLINEIST